jgi:hypothetical protein
MVLQALASDRGRHCCRDAQCPTAAATKKAVRFADGLFRALYIYYAALLLPFTLKIAAMVLSANSNALTFLPTF